MRKNVQRTISILLLLIMLPGILSGCRKGTEDQGNASETEPVETAMATPTVTSTPEPTATPEPTPKPTATPEPTATPTPEPTATPEPTPKPTTTPEPPPTPVPTPTPEPNPYVGVWTIGELPFSLELRSDGTYLASVIGQDKEGRYTYDKNRVILYPTENSSIEIHYYAKADTLKLGDFKLIRDDLVFFQDMDFIPVTFENENVDLSVSVRGAIVRVRMKNGKTVGQYCFTKAGLRPPEGSRDWFDASKEPTDEFSVFKVDGRYTLWTRDTNGADCMAINVEVVSGFHYPTEEDELEIPTAPLKALLKEERVTIDSVNRRICKDVAAAGFYTREGVVTAGVSLISTLAEYGYCVGYQSQGAYHAEKNWGVNARWGELLDTPGSNGKPFYMGMNEVASIIWAYKQAGVNLVSELDTRIGLLGEHEKSKDNRIDYDRARSGDIVKRDAHYLMVIDRLDQNGDGADDAYLTYEIYDGRLAIGVLPFKNAKKREFYSMDAVFDNTGRNARKALHWKNTFHIPEEEMPQYMLESMETETLDRGYHTLLKQLGFGTS